MFIIKLYFTRKNQLIAKLPSFTNVFILREKSGRECEIGSSVGSSNNAADYHKSNSSTCGLVVESSFPPLRRQQVERCIVPRMPVAADLTEDKSSITEIDKNQHICMNLLK